MTSKTIHERTMAKVGRHLIPFMILMYCVNFLDRVNVSFAALQMNHDLGFTPKMYGFAAGILFVGYTGFEIPSNILLARVGARRWLARIMISWGILGIANAFVHTQQSFYVVRFLLGVAEAGFFPGIIYYMMRWFPAKERAAAITLFMLGNPISVIFGSPVSSVVLALHPLFGLRGWQWLFILEGAPAILLGFVALRWLTESPDQALWLLPEERSWLIQHIAAEDNAKPKTAHMSLGQLFSNGKLLALAASKFCVLLAFFGITLWLPQIIKSMGNLSNYQTGFVTAVPYIFSAALSVVVSRHSDKTGERTLHIALPALVGCVGFLLTALSPNPYLQLLGLCVAATGLWISNAVFWTLPANLLAGTSAAAGIAMINTFGNLGGFFGPYLTGWLTQQTKSYTAALMMLSGFLLLSAVIILLIGWKDSSDRRKLLLGRSRNACVSKP